MFDRVDVSTERVPGPVVVDVLRPASCPAGAPLLLWLHGGDGAAGFADRCRPAFVQAWTDGILPPLTVAMPHSGRSFWLDGADASDPQWETFVAHDLVDHLRDVLGVGEVTAVGGVSMGGMGSLRMALRRPERFAAVAALEPAIEPTPDWSAVPLRDLAYRHDAVLGHFGDPVDADRFRHHHPLDLARRNGPAIAASGLGVYIEVGDEDSFDLTHGAEALHRLLFDIGLRHEYRLVRGADHVGRTLGTRMVDALGFVGRALAPTPPDDDPAVAFLREMAVGLHRDVGLRRTTTVAGPAGPIEVHEYGTGPPVVLLPSLGRGAADFDDLAHRLARAGYRAVHPEPRGVGGSHGSLDGLTMADLAADVAAVVHGIDAGPVTLVGHAFGNRVARMTATDYPHLVDSVVLLCCGGLVPPAPEHAEALGRVFDTTLDADARLAAVGRAFFAPGNDATVWADGWHPDVAAAQGRATTTQPVAYWWEAGGKDVYVVQPADDVVAVPENAERLWAGLGDRATMVTVPRAGHALLPEQPDAVEVALRTWLTRECRR